MNLDNIPFDVLKAVRERGHSDATIELMRPREIFEEYCEWEGLINWSARLYNIVLTLEGVK